MSVRIPRSTRLLTAALAVAFVSPAGAADERYVDYAMRQVSKGLAAERAVTVVERLEGAALEARYCRDLTQEYAPDEFVRTTSEALWKWLEKETEPWVRHLAAEALARVGAVGNRQYLRALLRDQDPTVRARAADLFPLPLTGDEETEFIQRFGVEDLWWVKKEILSALAGGTTERSLKLLQDALSDPCRDLRAAASTALGRRPDVRSIEPLTRALDHAGLIGYDGPEWALGAIKCPAAAEALRPQVDSPYAPVRFGAAVGLGRIGDKRSVPALGRLLDDEDPMVADAAADALAEIGGSEAALHLLRSLSLDDYDPRWYTVLRMDRGELLRACETYCTESQGSSGELQRRRQICDFIKKDISGEQRYHVSDWETHVRVYSPFRADAREVAPERGRNATGWEDFVGRRNHGKRHALRAGALVKIWKASYYQGETWLQVTEGVHQPYVWVREADLRVVPLERLKHLIH